MTILGKLRGEIKDQEKVPLPMNLNDEALMHHGSLIAVSIASKMSPLFFCFYFFCAISCHSCPCQAPPSLTSLPFGLESHKFREQGEVAGGRLPLLRNKSERDSDSDSEYPASAAKACRLSIFPYWNSRCPCTLFVLHPALPCRSSSSST